MTSDQDNRPPASLADEVEAAQVALDAAAAAVGRLAAAIQPDAKPQPAPRIQTSVRLKPEMWAALNDLATRKRVEEGRRVTVHDLLIDGALHMLAVNGIKLSKRMARIA